MLSIKFLYPVQYFLQSQVNKDWHFCSTGSISFRCASTSFSCFARKISTISYSSNPLFRPIEEIWHHRDQVGTWHVCIHRLWSQHFWWSQPLGYSDVTCSLPTQNKLWHHPILMRCMASFALVYSCASSCAWKRLTWDQAQFERFSYIVFNGYSWNWAWYKLIHVCARYSQILAVTLIGC